jgi:multiple sugar transport system ATP-binding protein
MGRAIVRQPDAFLFDEPLSNLDAKLRGQTRTEISRLQHRLGRVLDLVTLRGKTPRFRAADIGEPKMSCKPGLIQREVSK